jgi:hypothetical protein
MEKAVRLYRSPEALEDRSLFSGAGSPGYTRQENTSWEIS